MLYSTVERVDCMVTEPRQGGARRIHAFNGGEANCLASPRILVRSSHRTAVGKILCAPAPLLIK